MTVPAAGAAASAAPVRVPAVEGSGAFAPGPGSDALKGRGPKGYARTDDHIRHAIEERLAADPTLDPEDIEVAVTSGVVTLTGTVAGIRSRYAAVAVAEDIAAPGNVRDALTLR
jgi:osmotically-inducible protein OsmY